MSEKLHIKYPIIVEGKYDKIKLSSIIDGVIIPTDGFAIFKSDEKRSLIKAISKNERVIVLTDSDSAGNVIRSHIKGIIPKEKIINLYTPALQGKEKRKTEPSKEGILGVEGQNIATLYEILSPFCDDEAQDKKKKPVTKADFYEDGLSGGKNSSEIRQRLALSYNLPPKITANALLEALNIISDYNEYKNHIKMLGESK